METVKALLRVVIILVIPAVLAFSTYKILDSVFFSAVDPNNKKEVLFPIAPGSTFKQICKELEAQGLVRHAWSLDIISRFKRVDKQIKAGEYALNASMRPTEILQTLASGKIFERKVTVKEGVSVWEIGELVEKAGLLPKSDFNVALVNPDYLGQVGIPSAAGSFEGYLFPETYSFSRPIDAKHIILTMVKQGLDNWSAEFTQRADELKFTRHEILTLASIIEKESGENIDEQPLVSAVFHNRLKQGMKLQADPTVAYGVPDFSGVITQKDLDNPTPYNTYTNFGLPPGPIANPGFTAIKAALYPADSPALYFVSNGQGGHVFTNSNEEHNAAKKEVQNRLRGQ